MKRNIIIAGLFIIVLAMLFGCKDKCETCTTTTSTYRNGNLVTNSVTVTTFEVCDEDDINDYRDNTNTTTWQDGNIEYMTQSYTKCK